MRLVDLMLVFPRFFLLLAVLAIPAALDLDHHGGHRPHRLDGRGAPRPRRVLVAAGTRVRPVVAVDRRQRASASSGATSCPTRSRPVLVAITLGIPAAILAESGLSFLGLGVQPPHATWGNILSEGKDAIEIGWWLSVYPGVAILVTVLSYNLLGEGIRDALDPRLRQSVGRIVSPTTIAIYFRLATRRSGGTGRRARLRGVGATRGGSSPPLRHQKFSFPANRSPPSLNGQRGPMTIEPRPHPRSPPASWSKGDRRGARFLQAPERPAKSSAAPIALPADADRYLIPMSAVMCLADYSGVAPEEIELLDVGR